MCRVFRNKNRASGFDRTIQAMDAQEKQDAFINGDIVGERKSDLSNESSVTFDDLDEPVKDDGINPNEKIACNAAPESNPDTLLKAVEGIMKEQLARKADRVRQILNEETIGVQVDGEPVYPNIHPASSFGRSPFEGLSWIPPFEGLSWISGMDWGRGDRGFNRQSVAPPEYVSAKDLKVEIVDDILNGSVRVTGRCGKQYEMSIKGFRKFAAKIEKQIEIHNLNKRIAAMRQELETTEQQLYKLQSPETNGFHFPC